MPALITFLHSLTNFTLNFYSSIGAPSLQDANTETCETFKSRSAPVIAKAQLSHNEELRKSKISWWRKLWDDDSPDSLTLESSGPEELNF